MAAAPSRYYEKHSQSATRPRQGYRGWRVKPLIPSEHPEKAFFATQEPFLQSERTILPSEPSKLPKSPQNAIFGNKKADRITPIGSHTCHVLVSFN